MDGLCGVWKHSLTMIAVFAFSLVAFTPGAADEHRCLKATAAPSLPAVLSAERHFTKTATACAGQRKPLRNRF